MAMAHKGLSNICLSSKLMRRFYLQRAVREIPFDKEEFLRLMGFGAALPSPFDELYQKVSLLLQTGTACAEAVIFEGGEVAIMKDRIVVAGIELKTGNKVASSLQRCEGIALFICTLGAEFESKMKSFQGDAVESYFADSIGSLQCEAFADIVHNYVSTEAEKEGFSVTNRYSPGYCNWSVGEQQKLFLFFTDTQTGIVLNDSSLMWPIKSISGMIGLGKGVKRIPYGCGSCTDVNCLYRKLKTKI